MGTAEVWLATATHTLPYHREPFPVALAHRVDMEPGVVCTAVCVVIHAESQLNRMGGSSRAHRHQHSNGGCNRGWWVRIRFLSRTPLLTHITTAVYKRITRVLISGSEITTSPRRQRSSHLASKSLRSLDTSVQRPGCWCQIVHGTLQAPASMSKAKKLKQDELQQKSPAEFFADNKNIAGFDNVRAHIAWVLAGSCPHKRCSLRV